MLFQRGNEIGRTRKKEVYWASLRKTSRNHLNLKYTFSSLIPKATLYMYAQHLSSSINNYTLNMGIDQSDQCYLSIANLWRFYDLFEVKEEILR